MLFLFFIFFPCSWPWSKYICTLLGLSHRGKKLKSIVEVFIALTMKLQVQFMLPIKKKEMIFSTSLDISNEVKHDCPSRASTHPRFPHVQIADAQLSPQCSNSAILLTDSTQPRHNWKVLIVTITRLWVHFFFLFFFSSFFFLFFH